MTKVFGFALCSCMLLVLGLIVFPVAASAIGGVPTHEAYGLLDSYASNAFDGIVNTIVNFTSGLAW